MTTIADPLDCPVTTRAAWPHTFSFGEFVRLSYHPELWGRIVGPASFEGRWIFEYPGGARITNGAEAFETFEPTVQQRRQTAERFAALAVTMERESAERRRHPLL